MSKKKLGRPSKYTQALADEITDRLAKGESLRAICRDDGMPDEKAVRVWAIEDREGFYPQYTRAREIQAHHLFDQTLEIADDGTNDTYEDGEVRQDVLARSKLRIDTRKWYLSKVLPKVYSDKQVMEVRTPDGPLQIVVTRQVVQAEKGPPNRIAVLAEGNGNGDGQPS